jgi:rare lipoprotein A (peptidoglycan hydrolase)
LSHALVWVSLTGALLAGCSTVPDSQRPTAGPPLKIPETPATGGEPVPEAEPPSRSGNADTYVVFGRRYRVRETSEGYREQGIASWYGRAFHGRKTASGPCYNMFDLTAAHKSLPIPSYARVTNLENGRSAVVKVNDRGPFVGKRLIDLSYAAADRLDMLGRGTAPVEVVAVEPYQFVPKLAARRAEQRERLASRASRLKTETEAAEIELARATPVQSSTPVPDQLPDRLTLADMERSARPVKTPARLALADGERGAPKVVTRAVTAKPARAEDNRNPRRAGLRPPSAAPASKGRAAVVKKPVLATSANRAGKSSVPARQAGESRSMGVRLAGLKTNRSRGVAD